ncbi:hypothetical protein ACJX0J_024876 [Zea mays]
MTKKHMRTKRNFDSLRRGKHRKKLHLHLLLLGTILKSTQKQMHNTDILLIIMTSKNDCLLQKRVIMVKKLDALPAQSFFSGRYLATAGSSGNVSFHQINDYVNQSSIDLSNLHMWLLKKFPPFVWTDGAMALEGVNLARSVDTVHFCGLQGNDILLEEVHDYKTPIASLDEEAQLEIPNHTGKPTIKKKVLNCLYFMTEATCFMLGCDVVPKRRKTKNWF